MPPSIHLPSQPSSSNLGGQFKTHLLPTMPLPVQPVTSPLKHTISLRETGRFDQIHRYDKKVVWAALAIACISVFVTALNQIVVITALPQMVTDLGIPITQLTHATWIIGAYLLGFIVVMPLMGRISDIYGRRRIFLLALTIFGIGSLCCGLAPIFGQIESLGPLSIFQIDGASPSLIWFIAARFVQAIGGGAIIPVAIAMANDFYGQDRRGIAVGLVVAVVEAGGILGPLYGAVIMQHWSWQYIFYFNMPIVIGLLVAAWFLIPMGNRLQEDVDWVGATFLGLALICLGLGLQESSTSYSGPITESILLSFALAGVFGVAFVIVERRVRWPIIDLSLFKRPPFIASCLLSLFVGVGLIVSMSDNLIFVNTVLQDQVAVTDIPLVSSLILLRLMAMLPVGALLGGWLCTRFSCRLTAVFGLLFTATGFYLMSLWPAGVDWPLITISLLTVGLGFGLVIAPISITAINTVKSSQTGSSAAIVLSLRILSVMFILAIFGSSSLIGFKYLNAAYPPMPTTATVDQFILWGQGYAHYLIKTAHGAYSAMFLIFMLFSLIAIIPAMFLWGRSSSARKQGI